MRKESDVRFFEKYSEYSCIELGKTKARQLDIVEKIFNKSRSIIHHMGIMLLILPFTLVLLLSTLFYLQPREFRMAFALVPGSWTR